jgi:hypothetical protein
MGKRGPKRADYGLLSVWEFEFYKAFHLLRDGYALPARQRPPVSGLTRSEASTFLAILKGLSAEDYYLATRKLAVECGQRFNLEIVWLEGLLKPRRPKTAIAGMKIWRDLVRANTYADVRRACGRWSRLPTVLAAGLTPFPDHVRSNAAPFIAMKRNKRFPKSDYGDDSRIEFLARGMAGIMVGASPLTGVERLRNLKHAPGGPFWIEREGDQPLPRARQHCGCWRCGINRGNELSKALQPPYDNGFKAFMEVAAKTKAPKEWADRRCRQFVRKP